VSFFMAFIAVRGDHFSRVRFVALCALRYLPVDVMTLGTVKGCMLALILSEQPAFLPVAEPTGIVARVFQ
jgi:hypothetical protein